MTIDILATPPPTMDLEKKDDVEKQQHHGLNDTSTPPNKLNDSGSFSSCDATTPSESDQQEDPMEGDIEYEGEVYSDTMSKEVGPSNPVHQEDAATSCISPPSRGTDDGSSDLFAPAFFCPLSQNIFEDPVVVQSGITFERAAAADEFGWKDQNDEDKAYSNRALKSIIDETRALSGDSVAANLRRLQRAMSNTLGEVIDNAIPNADLPNQHHPLPEGYYCPITFNLMHDPVIDPEGNTFERVAVENWIRVNHNSPVTRSELSLEQIYPNDAMKSLLAWEANKPDEDIHPAVAEWKKEKAPESSDPAVGGNLTAQDGSNANATPAVYPRTFTELERRERNQRRAVMNVVGIIFAIFCLVIFVLYGRLTMLILFCITLMLVFNKQDEQ